MSALVKLPVIVVGLPTVGFVGEVQVPVPLLFRVIVQRKVAAGPKVISTFPVGVATAPVTVAPYVTGFP
ncbi:MAG TPA: hypothetical protein VFH54_15750 [Mycobacteriales bacterium]|nr:hypothetical protein [Mycobacteriales bacterium]